VQGEGEIKGKWADQVVRLNDVKAAIVMLVMPDGQGRMELAKFYTPSDEIGIQQSLQILVLRFIRLELLLLNLTKSIFILTIIVFNVPMIVKKLVWYSARAFYTS
jgi:hypothetical protein